MLQGVMAYSKTQAAVHLSGCGGAKKKLRGLAAWRPDVHAEFGHRLQEQQAVLGLGAEALKQRMDAAGAVRALADVACFGSRLSPAKASHASLLPLWFQQALC